ncbi:PREDICTED: probable LRR receptor-like serine/threonine-protein kinase At1g07650 [Erythranthe guttata]|uniref:probable LRR receptor-like serine/threonine-protein kinase At1g07650 n=1 Tax=Erythranthe guttata TaxID=4155 RepID=UPI00064DAB4D|nr:PREDICTED: probable LRR receptor-like serine/threonine-protein kinase At1g07650 [Erythranthe guttata]|eukprot:XP_012843380.1 PREDICTED: probable LRR receptor-like serine/threonine-protein kinase At1g07650 [Erythranthe guttata]
MMELLGELQISSQVGQTGDLAALATSWMMTVLRTRSSGKNNSSISGSNSKLYMDTRRSPLSLTYYGFCLINGNYTANLHFAEIMFTNDKTYSSLGRRIFDVYIQGKLVLKDFNIENEAGGVNKGIRRNFTAVVADNTLDIRFYWAGKWTNGIPVRGLYGPLISTISIDPSKSEVGNILVT